MLQGVWHVKYCGCCSCYRIKAWVSLVAEVINIEIILNSRSKTLYDAIYFHIELCHWQNTTPLRDSLFLLVEIRKGWSDSDTDSEFPVWEKTEVGQSTSQHHIIQVFKYSKLPGGFISLLQIKEDCYKVLFLDVGLSLGGFQFDLMIYCRSSLPESTLASLLDTRNQTNILLTIRSIIFHRQLVSAIRRLLAGFELFLPGLDIGMIVAIFHDSGKLTAYPDIIKYCLKVFEWIFGWYFRKL